MGHVLTIFNSFREETRYVHTTALTCERAAPPHPCNFDPELLSKLASMMLQTTDSLTAAMQIGVRHPILESLEGIAVTEACQL